MKRKHVKCNEIISAIAPPLAKKTSKIITNCNSIVRCFIPECESASPEWYPAWAYTAIPTEPGSDTLDNCQRYATLNSSMPAPVDVTSAPVDITCPASIFNQSRTENCQDYVYENTDTIVYDVSFQFCITLSS